MSVGGLVTPRPRPVQLSLLIEFMCQKTYTDLMHLVDLLPSKTDLEKKIELAKFFSRTRNLFIRLEALTKWANTSSKVDKCEKISNFLEEQSMLLLDTANILSFLHQNHLISARLPPFAMLLAIDIFVNKTYTRLPKAIKARFTPPEPISNEEIRMGLPDLNRIIKYRLSVSSCPRRFTNIAIASGPLIHPQQTRFLLQHAQSRILDSRFDRRPPLTHLYDMLPVGDLKSLYSRAYNWHKDLFLTLTDAFAMSLQLDVLFEQAQRLRSRRPTDPFSIEDYRPGQLLKVVYWRGLSNCNYQAVMGPDGKMRPTIYSITIHVNPLEPQRPLSVTHHPELNTIDEHKIGSFVKGGCLSIENLLTRTIIVRAERMLTEIRHELLPLSPGPISIGEVPLSLSVPVLWPCHPHEILQLRINAAQGQIRASFPSSDPVRSAPLLRDLEMAFNRPSARRVTLDRTSTIDCRAGSRGMRSLVGDDTRWQARLVEIFSRLRCLLGQWRVGWANRGRFIRYSLPLSVPPPSSTAAQPGYVEVLERARQDRVALVFIKLFPNDEHYLLCELAPTDALTVGYRHYLLKCVSVPITVTDLHVAPGGRWLTHNPEQSVLESAGVLAPPGVALRITHFMPLIGEEASGDLTGNAVYSSLILQPSLAELREAAAQVQRNRVCRRLKRVRALFEHLSRDDEGGLASEAKRRCIDRLPPNDRAMLLSATSDCSAATSPSTVLMPDLSRLLAALEDDVIVNELNAKLAEHGITHDGVINNAQSDILTIAIRSIPTKSLPAWARPGIALLHRYARRVIIISSSRLSPSTSSSATSTSASMRCWRLTIAFSNLPGNANGGELLHQSPTSQVNSLSDLNTFLLTVITEWEALCCLFAICGPVIENPACLPPDVRLNAFDARSLILAYGPGQHYLAELSVDPRQNCCLRLGVHPGPVTLKHGDDVDDALQQQWRRQRQRDLFENPHCVVREHLEFLVESQKSLLPVCSVLSSTLDFVMSMEVLRKPTIMTNSIKSSAIVKSARPIRSMSLMALSCFDLQLAYRGTLCLRFKLKTGHDATVHIYDGCHHQEVGGAPPQSRGGGISSEIYPVQGFVPLPAFQLFLESMQKAFKMEGGDEKPSGGFTVSQLDRMLRPSGGGTNGPVSPSALECYLSASLTFHAAFQAVNAHRWQVPSAPAIEVGEFVAKAPDSGLEVRLKMEEEEATTVEGVPRWRLVLRVTPDPVSCPAEGAAELGARIEEFFRRRVCLVSPQAAAITSFFRLLSLPGATLFDLVTNVFAWDLDSTSGGNNGLSILRVGLVSLATPAAPEPSVVLRSPSYLAMQIIIPRAPAFNEQSSSSGLLRASGVEVVGLTYDWSKNHVVIVASKRFQGLDEVINQRFKTTRACTLVQLISHMRKNPLQQGMPLQQQMQVQQ
ncbi:Mediator of RNA polymerase II transcription subunit [Echinococcus granulosus]|uniref:Mediator of RNA polymerase II transcription subunit 14 n=1 Tax=Echinococcus granulosus TaxID=6210 RepID=W6UYC1_ECHGR|nr:Mediator of RNA polymerase II transcription subunit [Echinococcus granulosus]EUB58559.1 Mediator of RNA polymerase II transcription subunit [Echinococcus granulosus]